MSSCRGLRWRRRSYLIDPRAEPQFFFNNNLQPNSKRTILLKILSRIIAAPLRLSGSYPEFSPGPQRQTSIGGPEGGVSTYVELQGPPMEVAFFFNRAKGRTTNFLITTSNSKSGPDGSEASVARHTSRPPRGLQGRSDAAALVKILSGLIDAPLRLSGSYPEFSPGPPGRRSYLIEPRAEPQFFF